MKGSLYFIPSWEFYGVSDGDSMQTFALVFNRTVRYKHCACHGYVTPCNVYWIHVQAASMHNRSGLTSVICRTPDHIAGEGTKMTLPKQFRNHTRLLIIRSKINFTSDFKWHLVFGDNNCLCIYSNAIYCGWYRFGVLTCLLDFYFRLSKQMMVYIIYNISCGIHCELIRMISTCNLILTIGIIQ